jgi:hypothetical protein
VRAALALVLVARGAAAQVRVELPTEVQGRAPLAARVRITPPGGSAEPERQATVVRKAFLPIRVVGATGDVTIGGQPLRATGAGRFEGELDLTLPLLDRPPLELSVRSHPAEVTETVVTLPIATAGQPDGVLEITVPPEPRVAVRRLLYFMPKPLPWAAPVGPEPPHPIVHVVASVDPPTGISAGEEDVVKRGGPPSISIDQRFLPPFARLRDVQLVGVERYRMRTVGRCICHIGKWGHPTGDEDITCDRQRWESRVTVYAARTGRTLAAKTFLGPMPRPCREGLDYLDLVPEPPRDIDDWLRAVAAQPGR